MITRTFGWVNRGAAWQVQMSLQSHSTRLSIKLHEQMSNAYDKTGSWTLYLLPGGSECTTTLLSRRFHEEWLMVNI